MGLDVIKKDWIDEEIKEEMKDEKNMELGLDKR